MPYYCMKKLIKMISSYKFSNFEFFLSVALCTFDVIWVSLTNEINLNFIIRELLPRFVVIAFMINGLYICNHYTWRIFYDPERFINTNVKIQIIAIKVSKIISKVLLCASFYLLSLTFDITRSTLMFIYIVVSISALPVLINKETPGVKGD